MGRFCLGTGLLAALLILGLYVSSAANSTLLPIADKLDQAADQILAGETQQGHSLANTAKNQWQHHWHRTAAYADHEPMDEIDGIFSQLTGFYQKDAHYAACCAKLAQLIRAVAEAHSPTWWNLL